MKNFFIGLAISALGMGIFWSPLFCENMTNKQEVEHAAWGLSIAFIGAVVILSGIAKEYCRRHHIE